MLLLAVLLGAAALVLVAEGMGVLRGEPRGRVNRRLRLLADAGGDGRVVLRKLGRRPVKGESGQLAATLLRLPPVRALDRAAGHAGLLTPIEHLVSGCCLTAAAAVLACLAAGLAPLPALAGGVGLAAAGWVLALRRLAARRTARFAEQFPEALSLLARSLRAGHPLPTAISLVGREMPDPLGSEFGMVFDEMTYGQDLRGALENLCRRVEGNQLRYMTVAIAIQQANGGNLADLLDRLESLLRQITRLHRKVKAVSAEARLSAVVLSILPFGVAAGMYLIAPELYAGIADDRPFMAVFCLAFAALCIGIAIMYRMVNFRF